VRRQHRAGSEIEALALAQIRRQMESDESLLQVLAADVAAGLRDPYSAADELMAASGV
jgi:hypothetical protein